MKRIPEGLFPAGVMFLLGALSACGSIPLSEQVRIRAANDLKCETSQVQTTQVDENTVRVHACGQERTYVQQCVAPKSDPVPTEAGFAAADTAHCSWVAREPGRVFSGNPGGAFQ